jgi:hypothetical protein
VPELIEIRLLDLPVEVHRRVAEHQDEIRRELTWIAEEPGSVPARLQAIGDQLREQYSGFTEGPTSRLDQAMADGQVTIDLVYQLPPGVGEAAKMLGDLLDEVDEFCRRGGMLALETPPEALAYRRWFLGEFVRQAAGEEPQPWTAWQGP